MTDNDDNIPPLEAWNTRQTLQGLVADSVALDLPRYAASSGVYLVVAASAFGAASHMGLPP